MPFPTVVLRRRSENLKALISCPWPGVVLVASPVGAKNNVLRNVPLDDTVSTCMGIMGRRASLRPHSAFSKE
jgi:hypothetical protein